MENDENKSNESQSNMNAGKSYKDSSPQEVKEKVKETVAKGVAAVAGALKGFSEEAKSNDLANSTKEAIQKAGETTREIAGTAKSEFQSTKEQLKGGSSAGMGSGSSGSSGSTYSGQSSSQSNMGMGGSSLGGSSTPGSSGGSAGSDLGSMPDLSKTKIGKSDAELEG